MKIDLQKLLDALAEGTELDSLLTEATGEDLSAIESEAIEAGKAIATAADRTPADADKIDAIVQVAQKVREVSSTRAEAAADLDKTLAEKMALLNPKAEEAEEEEPKAEEAEEEEPKAEEEEPKEPEAAEKELEPVAASTKPKVRVNIAEIKSRIPAPKPVDSGTSTHLVAAADIANVPAGSELDLAGLAASLEKRLHSLGPNSGRAIKGAAPTHAAVASLHRPDTPHMIEGTPQDFEAIEAAANERNLKGGSLTAAGSWCAPSEILYDLCDDGASLEGMISLPMIRARRGGFQWTTGPDFCEVYDSATAGFWNLTETQVDAGTTKPCFEIPCIEFDECRLNALGFCLTGGLLTRMGYPELVREWVRRASIAFAHWRNAYVINQVYSQSTDDGLIASCGAGIGGGATGAVLSALENQIISFRERHRLPFMATVEVKAPHWIKAVLRSDLAQRTGVDMINVSDAQINSWFAARGASVEYLYDWQALNSDCASGATANGWPGFVEFIMYRAGTFVEATQPIIAIDARFDASLTETNRYGIRFEEEGLCVLKRCNDARRFQIDLCPTGLTTAPETACTCSSI